MEFLHLFLNLSILITLSLFLFHHLLWKPKRQVSKKSLPPPPPEASGALPIIGHLHRLAGSTPLHRKLGKMADKYGPIFTIRTGVHRDLIVSNWEVAKECLTTKDKDFANRPLSLASKILTLDGAFFAFSPYGSYWREARKMAALELLSNQRLETLRHVREWEVKAAIKELYEEREKVMDMKKWFGDIILNVMCKVVVGKRYMEATVSGSEEESERSRDVLKHLMEYLGKFFVSDAIPWLRWVDSGKEKAMREMMRELDLLAQRWLDEHRMTKSGQDFMGVMVSILDEEQTLGGCELDTDTVIKYTSVGLMMAGRDTTSITMTWALALLLNNEEAMKKAQQEVEQHVGPERHVEESDIKNLVYLKAVVKETMRLYPALPFSAPHESIQDCTVAGYHIPARTRLLLNLSKLQRDPTVWDRPNEFIPERFLHSHLDVHGQHFQLLPFGSGRRICPGASLALQVVHLSIASLIHAFDFKTSSGHPVDMTEATGFQTYKTTPFHVLITPRLPPQAY